MKQDDPFYLKCVIEDARNIKENLPSYEEFVRNLILRTALLKFAENVGEGSKNISPELRELTSDHFPWKDWIRFRDRNVHAYFSVDYDIVWEALQDISEKVLDLDKLRDKLISMSDGL